MTLRAKTARILDRDIVKNAIIGVIVFNAIILGLEPKSPNRHSPSCLLSGAKIA